jgi:hypothetical protein
MKSKSQPTLCPGTLVSTPIGVGIVVGRWASPYSDCNYDVSFGGCAYYFRANQVNSLNYGPQLATGREVQS